MLSSVVEHSHLWRITLAERAEETSDKEARERLRVSFISFRERCAQLAEEIRKNLPDLTVHDITHLDALWEIGSKITGEQVVLTATEGYVLGGSILLHDLAMSVAATPGGLTSIKKDKRWIDDVVIRFARQGLPPPTPEQIEAPPADISKAALFEILRQLHAQNAERLAFQEFKGQKLIEDSEIRNSFGRIIGRIAHSHWWSIEEVDARFAQVIGAPHWCPSSWTVDPRKLACILRLADVSHLDARRAPLFLRAISEISPSSDEHWKFQGKLTKPCVKEDALVYSSGQAFQLDEAPAWWLCLDTLRFVDRELRSVDTLLADRNSQRLAARRVSGVESPERLASLVQTEGWLPINAVIHVGDLPQLVRNLGGDELYGHRPSVALRELIQNACDAIQARRILEKRDSKSGRITISIEEVEGATWLKVTDSGVGMSKRVLTDYLLNFGSSFWGSPLMREELPGLASGGMNPIGRYGIGFFSVFMAGDEVLITTRRSDVAVRDTLVLQFGAGLLQRPLLRAATPDEQFIEGGTCVAVKLRIPPQTKGGLLCETHRYTWTLADLCRALAPALEVELVVKAPEEKLVIAAGDWRTMEPAELLERVVTSMSDEMHAYSVDDNVDDDPNAQNATLADVSEGHISDLEWLKKSTKNLRNIEADGKLLGRAMINTSRGWRYYRDPYARGLVTVGGLVAARLRNITGLFVGESERASRDTAIPLVPYKVLRNWADEQARLIPDIFEAPDDQANCAAIVRACGGSTGTLPICKFRGQWLSNSDLTNIANLPDEVMLVDEPRIAMLLNILEESYRLNDNVILVDTSGPYSLLEVSGRHTLWPGGVNSDAWQDLQDPLLGNSLAGLIIEILAARWKLELNDLIKNNRGFRLRNHAIATARGKEHRTHCISVKRS